MDKGVQSVIIFIIENTGVSLLMSLSPINNQIGFIFDMDGVLTDTADYHYQSWERLAKEEGLPFNSGVNDKLRGRSRRDSLMIVLDGRDATEAEIQDMMHRKNAYFHEYIADISEQGLCAGIADLLREIRDAGHRIGVASASRNARLLCEKLGVMPFLDGFGDGYSIVNPKPAPDIFLWVAGAIGLPPNQCIVFEDAKHGVDAARSAGFATFGVGDKTLVGHADQFSETLEGFKIADIHVLPPH